MNRLNGPTRAAFSITGNTMSKSGLIYIMLITASVLMIASMCIPYYTDSTGASSGVYGSGKDCLGFMGSDCMTIHAFPVLTVIFGLAAFVLMSAHVSIPLIDRIPGMRTLKSKIIGLEGVRITIVPLLFLAMLFSVVTLATQLGTPLSGTSLADQAKSSTTPTTFKDGMALSAAATALFVFIFLIKTEILAYLGALLTKPFRR